MVGDPDHDRGPLRPKLSDARPGLRYALERIAAGDAHGLVVPGLRRLTRSVAELGPIIDGVRAARPGWWPWPKGWTPASARVGSPRG